MKLKKINQHFFQRERVRQTFLLVSGEINYESVAEVMEAILTLNIKKNEYDDAVANGEDVSDLEEPLEVINIFISSNGGDVSASFSLMAIMQGSEIPIRTIGLSECGSSAFMLLMKGHQRVVTPFCSLLSHQFSSSLEANYGNLRATLKEYSSFHGKICELYSSSTGLSVEEIEEKLLKDIDVWLTPEEALGFHVVDLISDLS